MDRSLGDLNAVVVFAKVVERQSFRGAALALGIPKSTVSLKVSQLEDLLETRLLERTTRTLRLTDAGTAYYRQAAPAIDALREAGTSVAALQKAPTGRLRLTTTVEFGQSTLRAVIDDYVRRFPSVSVQVELCDRRVDLIEEGFDLAIRAGALPDSTLIARALPASTLRLYASPAYLRQRGEPRRPEQLRDHECLIMSGHRAPGLWQFRSGRRSFTVEVHGKIQINSLSVLRDLAIADHGIARLPEAIGDEATARAALRRILDAFAPAAMPWHVVYPSARNLSPKVRAFIELLEQRVRPPGARPARRGPAR